VGLLNLDRTGSFREQGAPCSIQVLFWPRRFRQQPGNLSRLNHAPREAALTLASFFSPAALTLYRPLTLPRNRLTQSHIGLLRRRRVRGCLANGLRRPSLPFPPPQLGNSRSGSVPVLNPAKWPQFLHRVEAQRRIAGSGRSHNHRSSPAELPESSKASFDALVGCIASNSLPPQRHQLRTLRRAGGATAANAKDVHRQPPVFVLDK
jgi:hypothetical protein